MARSVVLDIIGTDKASPAFLRAGNAAERMAAQVAAASKKSAASSEAMTARIAKTQARVAATGAKMSRSLTLPIVAAAGVAVDQAVKYQKAMTLLQTAGGETTKKMAVISKGVMKVATDTGTSLEQLSEGMYTVAKAGSQKWSAVDQLKVLKAAAQGAKAENVPLATSVQALTSVMMSYHVPAADAVKVQNEMVVGAGRAKTSMQEYAGALSTVIPVASAAHISFAQVAGAIATLTQHGTSAQEATQELSNTIRGLLSPNMVAQKAMQQLGISVTDVSKNLGKRGLTGTIGLITDAITKKMGPGGLVIASVFKKSQSATADLGIELSHMPKHLADISKQFESGKLGYKDYYNGVKGLGGAAFEMGKNFIATMAQAKGFNSALASGSPLARTFASYLKAIMGGATGMNTALQLGGENAKYFADTTNDVAAAARKSGADVLGWAKTQDTLAVKMDKAKANLQVLAVEAGTALIPIVTKVVSAISKMIQGFENLSGTQKAVVGWSLGIMAAMGPVLSIGARLIGLGRVIGSFGMMVGRGLALVTTGTTGMSTKATMAVRGFTAALAGAAIGVSIGKFTQHMSGVSQAIGAVTSAAAGAAIGFGVGGPVGAAIGGTIGLVSNLATTFMSSGHSASQAALEVKAAMRSQNESASALLSTLESVNGAYGATYKNELIQQLLKKQPGYPTSPLNLAKPAGVNPATVTNAALGDPKAIDALTAKMKALKAVYDSYVGPGHPMNEGKAIPKTLQNQYASLGSLIAQLGNVSPAAKRAEQGYQLWLEAQGKGVVSSRLLAGGIKNLGKELRGHGTALTTDSNATVANSAYADRNTAIVKANIGAVNRSVVTELAHHKSIADVASAYESQINSMRANLVQMGFHGKALDTLITKYGKLPRKVATELIKRGVLPADIEKIAAAYAKVPKKKLTTLDAFAGPGHTKVQKYQNEINAIRQGKVPGLSANTHDGERAIATLQAEINAIKQGSPPSIYADTSPAMAALSALLATIPSGTYHFNVVADYSAHNAQYADPTKKKATGGWLHGPGSGTSDSIVARVSNGEFVVRASQARKHAAELEQINTPGFAKGGVVNGISYASARAVHNARVRAKKADQSTLTSAVSTSIGNIGQAAGAKFYVADVGINRIRGQIKAAFVTLNTEIGKGLSGAATNAFRHQLAGYIRMAQYQLRALKYKTAHGDLVGPSGVRHAAMYGTSDDLHTAYTQLTKDAANAGASGKIMRGLARAEAALRTDQAALAKTSASLTNARAAWNNAYSAAKSSIGAYDITTAGTVQQYGDQAPTTTAGSIVSSIVTAASQAAAYASLLKRLVREGLSPVLVNQLAAAGPTAMAQAKALASATPKQIGTINSSYTSMQASAKAGAITAADSLARGLITGLELRQSAINKAIMRIVNGMTKTLKKGLKIHSPSRVMRDLGQHTGEGYRLGLLDKVSGVSAASNGYANASVPAGQSRTWGTEVHHHHENHYHGMTIPEFDAAIQRREWMRTR